MSKHVHSQPTHQLPPAIQVNKGICKTVLHVYYIDSNSITSIAAYCSLLHLSCRRSVAQPTVLLQELGKDAPSEKWLLAAAVQWRLHLLIWFEMS